MSKFPSLPLFTDAFLADTMHLTAQETGAYLMLLMVAWRSDGCRLPDDDRRLSKWARVDQRTWTRIKPTVMEFWVQDEAGFWTQKRLAKEHDHVSKRADAARANGATGGRPKSLKENDPPNPTGSGGETQQKAPNPNPIQKEGEASASLGQQADRGVETKAELQREFVQIFWPAYPEKVAKRAALTAYVSARRRAGREAIMAGLASYVAAKPPDRRWAHAASWLNADRWEDVHQPQPANANRSEKRGTQAYLETLLRDIDREELERDEMLEEERRAGDRFAPRLLSQG